MDELLGTFSGKVRGMSRQGTGVGSILFSGDFPKVHPNEPPTARAHNEDFTYRPTNGDSVSFELWRVNGDLVARAIVRR